MKLATNDEENDQKSPRKWSRGDGRGILTPLERQKLENGTVDRHSSHNIHVKTLKAIDDFNLMLSLNCMPFHNKELGYLPFGFNLNAFEYYIQDLILILYKCHYHRLIIQRRDKGIKRKVQSKEVWKIVNKTLKDAKKNIKD